MPDSDQNNQMNQAQPQTVQDNSASVGPLSPIQEVVKTLKSANNVLIIISRDPSIDQLSASIGLTLALNRDDKHATAVFSGKVPPVIEFLEPDKTLEKNTDSLRDFIISLDKSKADKLRYKVEDSVVKIFITPYKTSISDADLDFSQGDFNVDAVVALGVQDRNDLDEAITAHGRILHDAVIISVSNQQASELGSIQWVEQGSSSLCEMTTDMISALDKKLFDSQIATALLTGVVYETDRFRNEKSTPHTMTTSGILMEAGASTQLVAEKLEEPHEVVIDESGEGEIPQVVEEEISEQEEKPEPGVIQIDHEDDQIHIDDSGKLRQVAELAEEEARQREQAQASQQPAIDPNTPPTDIPEPPSDTEGAPSSIVNGSGMVYEPPTFGGQLTANSEKVDQQYLSNPDPLATPDTPVTPTLQHSPISTDTENQTLSELEKSINSPHAMEYQMTDEGSKSRSKVIEPISGQESPAPPSLDYAQDAVQRAISSSNDYKPEPIKALGAQPVGLDLGHPQPTVVTPDNNQSSGTPPPPVPPPAFPMS